MAVHATAGTLTVLLALVFALAALTVFLGSVVVTFIFAVAKTFRVAAIPRGDALTAGATLHTDSQLRGLHQCQLHLDRPVL